MEVFWKKIVENEDLFTGFEKMSMDYSKQKCLVCGDKASGLHYTVVSCESCKSFFGRKIKSKAKFTCEANGNCVMDLYTRRHCPACRLKKCLDVGMKPERVWDEKRLETRKPLERKNKKKQQPQQHQQPTTPPVSTSTPVTQQQQQELIPKLSKDQEELINGLERAKEEARSTNFTYKPHGKFEQILQKVHELSMVFMGRDPKDYPYDPSKFQFPPMGMGGNFFGGGPPGGGPPGLKMNGFPFPKPMDLSIPEGSTSIQSHMNGTSEDSLDSEHSRSGTKTTTDIVKVKVEPGTEGSSPMDNGAPLCPQIPRSCESNGEAEDMKPDLDKGPESPALNQEVMIYNMTLMGVIIRQTVSFTKAIPAFRRLSYEDQAVLIKNAILEILILRCAENYNPERNSVVDDVTGSEWSCEAMMASGFATSAEPTLKFVQALHSMNLSKSELALMQAITIISPDRPDIENREDVEKIQRPMVETLQVLSKLNHPEDKVFFAKLIMKLTDVRDLVTRHVSDLMQMKLPDSQFENLFPLITEIFNL